MSPDEADRLKVLRSYGVMDTPPDPALDRITELARMSLDAPIALISLVDDARQWFKSRQGLGVSQTDRGQAFCAHALPLPRGETLVVPDALLDPRFADNPMVTGPPFIRFYAGAVLTSPEGANLGTLCVIDDRPRPDLDDLQRRTLRALADLAVNELEVRRARHGDATKLQLLELAESMSGVGWWRLDVRTGAVEWSDEVYRIHGVDRRTFDPQLDSALDFYDAEAREAVMRHVSEATRDKSGYAFQLRLRRRDGSWRDVVCKATCELDGQGEVAALTGVFQDVTEQVDLLRQVSEDRERYRLLTDNATDVIATYGPDGTFTFLSPAIARLVGRTPEDLVGRRTFEVIDPRDHARVAQEFTALVAGGDASARIEYRAVKADGEVIWLEAHPTPIRDAEGRLTGFQDAVRDVTARRAAQEAATEATAFAQAALAHAQESEARYRLLAENANDMIATTSMDSTVLFVTPAVQRLLGYAPEEVLGRKTLDLTHPEDAARVVALFEGLVAAGPSAAATPYQFRGRHKDGRWVWLEGQPRVQFDAFGRPLAFQDVVRDVSVRKAMETDLEHARTAAEAAAQAKADFLANMSHELRTPLTSIVGYTALASEQAELAPLTRDYVRRVQNASRALLATVNDILDFSKLEAGQVELHEAPADVMAICRDAVELFIPQAAAKDLRLEVTAPRGAPPPVLIDAERLLQLLLNLVGNAVKFTQSGSVSVTARHARGRLTVQVRDTGPGIAPEDQARLFQRFSQVDGSSTRSHGGTGLGLAICKGLAERMGGGIRVESAPGQGSTFILELPAARTAVGPKAVQTSARVQPLEALRVLVVDDNVANRELARIILAGAGAEVAEAASGGQALQVLGEQPFDAVLVDLRMPDLDGRTVMRRLRAIPGPNDAIPVIAYTADAPARGQSSPALAGFDGVVGKPVDPVNLLSVIKAAIETGGWEQDAAHG